MLTDNKKKAEEIVSKLTDKPECSEDSPCGCHFGEVFHMDGVCFCKYVDQILALCESIRAEALKEAIKEIEEQVIVGSAEGYRQGGGYVKDGVLKVLAKLSKGEEAAYKYSHDGYNQALDEVEAVIREEGI